MNTTTVILVSITTTSIFMYLYFDEMQKRRKAETDLRVVLKRKELDALNTTLAGSNQKYTDTLTELRNTPIPEWMLKDVRNAGASPALSAPYGNAQGSESIGLTPKPSGGTLGPTNPIEPGRPTEERTQPGDILRNLRTGKEVTVGYCAWKDQGGNRVTNRPGDGLSGPTET